MGIGTFFTRRVNTSYGKLCSQNVPVFWVVTGFMYLSAGVAWRLLFKTISKRRQSNFAKVAYTFLIDGLFHLYLYVFRVFTGLERRKSQTPTAELNKR